MVALKIDSPMPEKCSECWLCYDGMECVAVADAPFIPKVDECGNEPGRPDWCPLKEEKTGSWIYDPNGYDWNLPAWICSECNAVNANLPVMNGVDEKNIYSFRGSRFCPECGAKMGRRKS